MLQCLHFATFLPSSCMNATLWQHSLNLLKVTVRFLCVCSGCVVVQGVQTAV